MPTINLDLSALRTFVAAVELGGLGRAAQQVNRTPGAVSLQIKALEERLDQALFVTKGKQQRLTPAGETLLAHARRLLAANDDALLSLRGMSATGDVRVGMPQDLADTWLAPALAGIVRNHPRMRIHVRVARSAELRQAMAAGELDLAVAFDGVDPDDRDQIAHIASYWWGHPPVPRSLDEPLPLLLLDAPCLFRDLAIRALEHAGRSWRVAMSSGSVSAIWAAAVAGLGVTPRTALCAPHAIGVADVAWSLPPLPPVALSLRIASHARHPIVDHLAQVLRSQFAAIDETALRAGAA